MSASPELGPRVCTAPAPLPSSNLTLVGNLVTLSALTESDVPSLWSHLYPANQTPVQDPFDYVPFGPYSCPSEFWTYLSDPTNDLEFHAIRADPTHLNPSASPASAPDTRTHIVGIISFVNIDPANRALELAVINGDALKRTAAGSEAVYLMLSHAFGDTTGTAGVVGPTSGGSQSQGQGLQPAYRRVVWKCHYRNTASRRAAERLGFVFEGRFRQHGIVKGRNRDSDWFSLIDAEWPVVRSRLEHWLQEDNFENGVQKRSLRELRQGTSFE